MKRWLAVIGLLAAIQLAAEPEMALAEDALTNESIIDMIKLGLNEDVVITKIKVSKNKFDTSTGSLAKLQKAGVSINIIRAMIETGSTTGESRTENCC